MPDTAYREVLDDLFRLRRFGVKLDVLTPRRALRRLGDPAAGLPVIQIGGTNGKGSVIAFMRAILETAGHRVHAYTSPHLIRYNERIRLAGTEITEAELVAVLTECERVNDGDEITYFEITSASLKSTLNKRQRENDSL